MNLPDLRRRKGFTLLETLIVISIIALVAGISILRLSKPSDILRLQEAARNIVGALRLTRARAITGNLDLAFEIDVDERTYMTSVVPIHHFSSEIEVKLNVAAPERQTPSRGGFRFFPDGSSTGGDLLLSLNGKTTMICVNWLTGEAQQRERC
jgi:general secretion pathway protein H